MIKRMDVNSDGILSKDEIRGGFKEEFGLVLSPVELEALAVLFDGDGDGEVTFSEFRSAILTQSDKLHGKAVFNDCVQQMVQEMDRKGTSSFELLKAIDRDGSGDIDAKEFGIGVEAHLGLKLSDDDVVTLFKQFDLDGSGIIDSAEFISVMAKIRGEPDLQTAMEVIVDWMASKQHTLQTMMALFDQDGDGLLTPGVCEASTHLEASTHARACTYVCACVYTRSYAHFCKHVYALIFTC